jgi:PAS domain S-box-containing protein
MKNLGLKKRDLVKFFGIIIICISLVEFGLMYILEITLNTTHFWESFIDSLLLSTILSPILYLFIFRYFSREINSRVSLEEKFKYLFDNSRDAIMTLSPPDWRFTEGNKATLEIFGLKDIEQLKSITPADISPKYQPDGRLSSEKAKEMISLAVERGYQSFDWTHKKLNGQDFFANVSLTRISRDGITFLQAIVRDITEKKASAELIKKSEQELEKALAESERMNKLMVGREIEMIRLKKELADLKNR